MTTIPDHLLSKPLRIIAAALGVSHETARQLRNQQAGKCQLCGDRDPFLGSKRCLPCIKKDRTRTRKVNYKPWKPGSPGRPPIENKVDNRITIGDS
jgi:hypothetical protein